jgi:hypothetical protein
MGVPKLKATGQRGSWFAEVDGESIPCGHKHWTRNTRGSMVYDDPYFSPETEAKWEPFVAALKAGKRVILTNDNVSDEGHAFERTGYIALYAIDNVEIVGENLRFRFIKRLAELE